MPIRPALLLVLVACATGLGAAPLRFFAVGDLPYSEGEVGQMRRLLHDAVQAGAPFILHVGDIKSGGSPCTDERLLATAGIFRVQPVPIVYAPGDNEWTDCHRLSAGRMDPMERLDRLRELFFEDPQTLRLARLQRFGRLSGPLGASYPEIYTFALRGVRFAVLHVVGSDNNNRTASAAARAEMRSRDTASLSMLADAAAQAQNEGAHALVIVFHADIGFEEQETSSGFRRIYAGLVGITHRYSGPVLLIHGDTHRPRFDQPLRDPAGDTPIERFYRAEVPGSPRVGGLRITVFGGDDQPFSVEEVYPTSIEALQGR